MAPAIVLAHGLTAVKEMYLDAYARAFQASGFAALVFDYRFLGASGGEPRGRIVPQDQQDDFRAALDWLTAQPQIDAERIGIWGTSFSGGHAMVMGALDPRIKAVVAQVPAIGIAESLVALNGREGLAALLSLCQRDHAARQQGLPGQELPAVAPAGQPSVMPSPDAYAWFTAAARDLAPAWRNAMSLESLARAVEYVPGAFIGFVSPKPLLIQAARHDALIPFEQVERAFARAGEPKRLDIFDCGHFGLYAPGPLHDRAVAGACAWFTRFLQ
jgi:fermentation-respiration switch protein FrsA (DUF1100 family)